MKFSITMTFEKDQHDEFTESVTTNNANYPEVCSVLYKKFAQDSENRFMRCALQIGETFDAELYKKHCKCNDCLLYEKELKINN